MATDPLDRLERMLIRCIEEDRRERRLKREQRKNGTLPEAERRREEWLTRKKKEMEDWENNQSSG